MTGTDGRSYPTRTWGIRGLSESELPASTPATLLAALSTATPQSDIKLPPLSPQLAARLGQQFGRPDVTVDELLLGLREAPQRLFEAIVRGAAPPGAQVESLLGPEGVRVVALPTTGVNAYATFAANGLPLVIVNQGLITFLYNFLRVLSTRFRFPHQAEASLPPLAETATKLGELLEWSSLPSVIPRVATFPVTDQQMKMASALATACERFVVAHEFAHIFLHHHEDAHPRSGLVAGRAVEVVGYAHVREYEADRAGVNVILELISNRQVDATLAYAGIELFFATAELLTEAAVNGAAGDEDHPPPAARLESVREYMRQVLPDAARRDRLARVAWSLLELIADLRDRALAGARSGYRQAESEVRRLLTECAAREHPDHPRFQREITALLDRHPAATLTVMRGELTADGGWARNRRILAASFAAALPAELRGLLVLDER